MYVCQLKVLFQITNPLCVVCIYLFRLVISPHEMFRFFTAPFFFAKPPLTRKTIYRLFWLSTWHFIYKRYITFGLFGFFVVYQSNYGSHFILGFTAQFYDGIYRPNGYNEITIIARFDANVTVTSLMKDLLNTISIKAGKVFTLTVPRSYRMEETRIEKKGIEIKSTGEIAVIGANHAPGSSDAFLALPTTILGKTYVVATRLNSGPSLNLVNIGIISQRDGTKVTITLKTKGYFRYLGFTYTNGQSFTITLAKLETFHLMHNNDLSGTIITSSYPVAVLSGSPCENIGFSYCDSNLIL